MQTNRTKNKHTAASNSRVTCVCQIVFFSRERMPRGKFSSLQEINKIMCSILFSFPSFMISKKNLVESKQFNEIEFNFTNKVDDHDDD